MATNADWTFLRDAMVSIDSKVEGIRVSGPDTWKLPSNIAEEAAGRGYLEAVVSRLEEIPGIVSEAIAVNPVAETAGREITGLAIAAAKRARKITKDVAHDMAGRVEKLIDSLEQGGENIATGFGIGAGFLAVVGLLLLVRALEK